MLGSGAVVVMGDQTNLLAAATNVLRFFRNESCGKCVPCRVGSHKAHRILTDALERGADADGIDDRIDRLEETLRLTSICGLGQVALGPVMSVLRLQRTPTRPADSPHGRDRAGILHGQDRVRGVDGLPPCARHRGRDRAAGARVRARARRATSARRERSRASTARASTATRSARRTRSAHPSRSRGTCGWSVRSGWAPPRRRRSSGTAVAIPTGGMLPGGCRRGRDDRAHRRGDRGHGRGRSPGRPRRERRPVRRGRRRRSRDRAPGPPASGAGRGAARGGRGRRGRRYTPRRE